MSLTSACQFAQDFARNCPAWDPEVETVKAEVCALAADPCAEVANWAESTKRASASMVRGQLQTLTKPVDVSAMNDPNEARKGVSEVQKQAALLRCYDATAGAEMGEEVTRWSATLDAAITQELACRAAPECMAQRVGAEICSAIVDRRESVAAIAHEKHNLGGVVDLAVLHDLGEKVQFDDASLSQLRARYASLAHHPFGETACGH